MLNHLGLSVSWKKFTDYLEERLERKSQKLMNTVKSGIPVILLIDNINIYREKRKHLRLFNHQGPKMWNFTGQAILFPDIEYVKDLLDEPDKCLKSQHDILNISGTDILIESDLAKVDIWEKHMSNYLTEVLDDDHNKAKLLPHENPIKSKNEQQLLEWLKKSNFTETAKTKCYDIQKVSSVCVNRLSKQSAIDCLPLSLADNSTIAGTLSILQQLPNDFSLPANRKGSEHLPLDLEKKLFDVKSARRHYGLLITENSHQTYMNEMENQMRSLEKDTEVGQHSLQQDPNQIPSELNVLSGANGTPRSTTLENEQRQFRENDLGNF